MKPCKANSTRLRAIFIHFVCIYGSLCYIIASRRTSLVSLSEYKYGVQAALLHTASATHICTSCRYGSSHICTSCRYGGTLRYTLPGRLAMQLSLLSLLWPVIAVNLLISDRTASNATDQASRMVIE